MNKKFTGREIKTSKQMKRYRNKNYTKIFLFFSLNCQYPLVIDHVCEKVGKRHSHTFF